jgi:hypothetical protein
MNQIQKTYESVKSIFIDNNIKELCQYSLYFDFENSEKCKESGEHFFNNVSSNIQKERKEIEQNYYTYLFSGLKHRIIELDFMTCLNIFDSRRLIFTNLDCISSIQILFRDVIYLSVNFRSSHLHKALPSDIEFICSIPHNLINFLENELLNISEKQNKKIINNIRELKNKEVQIFLSFGSLHID